MVSAKWSCHQWQQSDNFLVIVKSSHGSATFISSHGHVIFFSCGAIFKTMCTGLSPQQTTLFQLKTRIREKIALIPTDKLPRVRQNLHARFQEWTPFYWHFSNLRFFIIWTFNSISFICSILSTINLYTIIVIGEQIRNEIIMAWESNIYKKKID